MTKQVVVALMTMVLGTACQPNPKGSSDQPGRSDKPQWCEKSFQSVGTASAAGSTAILGTASDLHTLIVFGEITCGPMEQLTKDLLGRLDACANGQLQDCRRSISSDDLERARAAIEPTPIRTVDVAGVSVEVSVGEGVAMAQWSIETAPEKLLSSFQFPGQPQDGNAGAVQPTSQPTSGAASGAVALAGAFQDCIAVPCLPGNCTGNDGPDRDRFATPLFAFACDCSGDIECNPARTEDECTCYSECCSDAGSAQSSL